MTDNDYLEAEHARLRAVESARREQDKRGLAGERLRVVYNDKHGGFSLSDAAERLLRERLPGLPSYLGGLEDFRHHPELVRVVEELGEAASGQFARLRIHVLMGTRYRLREYDGWETVVETEDEWTDATMIPAVTP